MKELSGVPVVERIEGAIEGFKEQSPSLAIYLIGDDPASRIYARSKVKRGKKLGIDIRIHNFNQGSGQNEVEEGIRESSSSKDVDGIMVERPLPKGFDLGALMSLIPPSKDVEGLTPCNYGLLSQGSPRIIPPTPLGAILLTMHYGIETSGKNVVVMGRSVNVGRPLYLLLSSKAPFGNATVSQIHSRTREPENYLRNADLVYSAVGKPGMIKGKMIKEGAVLIDMGISTVEGEKGIFGDVDSSSVDGVASALTPTPGGTGPVTVASIFLNLFICRGYVKGEFPNFEDRIIRNIYG